MDDLDLINSVEQVEVMVNSIQKGAENQKTSALVMLENLLGVFLICSTLFRSKSNLHEYSARLRGATLVKKPPGSWRDLGGIPPGFPPGPAEILAAGISVPRRESRRDPSGIPSGSCRDFGRRDFRSPP